MKEITDYLIYELEHNSSPRPRISIFADLNYDYIYNSPPLVCGKEVIISRLSRNLAGAGGYVACGLAKLGAEVHLITELGDDEDGKSLVEEITKYGVHTEGIAVSGGKKSPFTLIFTDENETFPRQVATYPGTLKNMSIDSFDYKGYVNNSNLVYSCNYFIIQRLREEIRFVFRYARQNGVITAYDANAGDGWESERALRTLRESIYPLTDIVFLNQEEAFYLTQTNDPLIAIQKASPSSTTVAVKRGPDGALIRHRGKIYRFSAFPLPQKIKDTVGAGDAFQAAFLYFYLKKLPIELCGILACANAASTVTYNGGIKGQLDYEKIKLFISRYKIYDEGGGVFTVKY